jgi:hypothetical protein
MVVYIVGITLFFVAIFAYLMGYFSKHLKEVHDHIKIVLGDAISKAQEFAEKGTYLVKSELSIGMNLMLELPTQERVVLQIPEDHADLATFRQLRKGDIVQFAATDKPQIATSKEYLGVDLDVIFPYFLIPRIT